MQPSVWSPLRYPVYRLFWCCAFLSNLGTWIQDIAASWLMTHLSASPLVISLLSFSSSLPVVLLSIPAGFMADFMDRRKILLFAQAVMFFAALILGLQASSGQVSIGLLLTLSFAMGLGVAFNGPAYQTVLAELVPNQEQRNAVLVYYMGINITRVVGPTIGGIILGMFGASHAFFVNAVSFLGLIIFYWRWPVTTPAVKPMTWKQHFQTIDKKDWEILFSIHNLKLWTEIFIVSFCASALWALYPVRGRLDLHLESLQYGSLLGFFGLGAFASALMADYLMQKQRLRDVMAISYLVYALGETILGAADTYLAAGLGMMLGGFGWIVLTTLMNMSTRQIAANTSFKATMLGIFLAIFYFGMAMGSITWGAMARQTSAGMALCFSAFVLSLISVIKFARSQRSR